jgi:hypothetical protein
MSEWRAPGRQVARFQLCAYALYWDKPADYSADSPTDPYVPVKAYGSSVSWTRTKKGMSNAWWRKGLSLENPAKFLPRQSFLL